ncbi:hypothetical protein ACPDHL_07305 [Myroides sp. C15-4]|uniref:hypothetical protein n=1 Tax=Myroides sp. C15-4 TaxID=3400532 RepID=UPI003D2F78CB
MKNTQKSILIASLSVFLFSCSSDDSSTPPPPTYHIEKTPYISEIQQSFYESPDPTREGNPQDKIIDINYDFTYDADFNLQHITYKDALYKNQVAIPQQDLQLQPTLDPQGRLKLWEIKEKGETVDDYVYQYQDDRLTAITYNLRSKGGSFTSQLSYNDNNQLVLNEALEANLLIDYKYNAKNQIDKMKFNGQNVSFTYDDKKSPFYSLPFDLTSVLINFNFILPYTYHFPNNVTSIVLDGQMVQADYTYNENDLPLKVVYYTMENEEKIIDFEINYSYKIKETKVEQSKL